LNMLYRASRDVKEKRRGLKNKVLSLSSGIVHSPEKPICAE
jgi:hypothetical protein